MATIYTKTSSDFISEPDKNTISLQLLKKNIDNSNLLTPLQYVNRVNDIYSFCFYAELTTEYQTMLDDIVANYKTTVFDNFNAILRETKPVGSNGGTFTQDVWVTRTINEMIGSNDFVSVSGNQFTLQPGIYDFIVCAPAAGVYNHRCRIYDITHSAVIANGTNSFSENINSFSLIII